MLSSHLLWNIIYSVSMWRSAEWGAHVPQCVCGRERAIDGGQFLPSSMWVLRDQTQAVRLSGKCLYLLSHTTSPHFLKTLIFGDVEKMNG